MLVNDETPALSFTMIGERVLHSPVRCYRLLVAVLWLCATDNTTRNRQTTRHRACKRDNKRASTKGRENVATTNDRRWERNRNYRNESVRLCILYRMSLSHLRMCARHSRASRLVSRTFCRAARCWIPDERATRAVCDNAASACP